MLVRAKPGGRIAVVMGALFLFLAGHRNAQLVQLCLGDLTGRAIPKWAQPIWEPWIQKAPGQMNCPCAKILPAAKCLYAQSAPAALRP